MRIFSSSILDLTSATAFSSVHTISQISSIFICIAVHMNIYIYIFNISNKYVGLCLMDDKQPVFSIFLVMQSLLGCLLKCAKLYLIDNQLIMKKWCKSKKIYYLFLIF